MKTFAYGEKARELALAKVTAQKKPEERIEGFNGYFEFLRSEYPSQVYFDG
jgi:hypothetical protein